MALAATSVVATTALLAAAVVAVLVQKALEELETVGTHVAMIVANWSMRHWASGDTVPSATGAMLKALRPVS